MASRQLNMAVYTWSILLLLLLLSSLLVKRLFLECVFRTVYIWYTSEERTESTPARNGALPVELSQRQFHVEQRNTSNNQHQYVRDQKRPYQSHTHTHTHINSITDRHIAGSRLAHAHILAKKSATERVKKIKPRFSLMNGMFTNIAVTC